MPGEPDFVVLESHSQAHRLLSLEIEDLSGQGSSRTGFPDALSVRPEGQHPDGLGAGAEFPSVDCRVEKRRQQADVGDGGRGGFVDGERVQHG